MERYKLRQREGVTKVELEVTASTNDYLRHNLRLYPGLLTVATAEYQTAGRGATGQWESGQGENLLFSLLSHPTMLDAADIFLLSQTACLAICKALERYGEEVSIKWPNDIYWGDKKMVGILIENELAARKVSDSIMGVGVNVNQQHFPLSLPNPTSLALELGHEVERGEVLEGIVAEFCALYDALMQGRGEHIRVEYLNRLYRCGKACTYRDQDGEFTATLLTVEPGGHLVLRDERGTLRRYAFKEVNFIKQTHTE